MAEIVTELDVIPAARFEARAFVLCKLGEVQNIYLETSTKIRLTESNSGGA